MKNKITLGQALAFLRFKKITNGNDIYSQDKEVKEYLDSLDSRAKVLSVKYDQLDKNSVFNTLIKEKLNFEDFFLHLFLNEKSDEDCLELLKFFNNNIDYFEAYSQVLSDYIQKSEELKLSLQEKL